MSNINAAFERVQDLADSSNFVRSESLRSELRTPWKENQSLLQDRERPLRERVTGVDILRDQMARLEQEITDLVKEIAKYVVEAAAAPAHLEEQTTVADIQEKQGP